jgi:hypothetical protein
VNERVSAPTAAFRKEKRRHRFLKIALSLAVLHLAIAVQLIPVIGLFAAIYVSFPPIIFFVAYDTASASPLFALITSGTSLSIFLGLRSAQSETLQRFPRLAKWLALSTLAIWIPVGCGEAVRWSLMEVRIASAEPQCHETTTLLASLRQRYGFNFDGNRQTHAWMIRHGEAWLWSYRSLRFEPAPDWYRTNDLIEICGKSTQ